MKKSTQIFISLLLLLLVVSGCSSNAQSNKSKMAPGTTCKTGSKVELTISAAASLQNALTDIKTSFEKANPNIIINYNFGASGTLEQQISQGAPADLFFSAAKSPYQKLVKAGLIDQKNGTNLLGNALVLIVPTGSNKGISSFADLTKADKIALGTPASVPAGQYGQETLEKLNVWSAVQGKVVYGKDVRTVLSYVETGNVDAGIVYKTDALTSSNVKIVATAADNTHDPIVYPVGVIKNSSHLKEATQFYNYLQGQTAMKIFEKYGFKAL